MNSVRFKCKKIGLPEFVALNWLYRRRILRHGVFQEKI